MRHQRRRHRLRRLEIGDVGDAGEDRQRGTRDRVPDRLRRRDGRGRVQLAHHHAGRPAHPPGERRRPRVPQRRRRRRIALRGCPQQHRPQSKRGGRGDIRHPARHHLIHHGRHAARRHGLDPRLPVGGRRELHGRVEKEEGQHPVRPGRRHLHGDPPADGDTAHMGRGHAQRVQQGEGVRREARDRRVPGNRGAQPVPAQVAADHAMGAGQRLRLGVPHMQAGAEAVEQEQRRPTGRPRHLHVHRLSAERDEHPAVIPPRRPEARQGKSLSRHSPRWNPGPGTRGREVRPPPPSPAPGPAHASPSRWCGSRSPPRSRTSPRPSPP